MDKQNKKIPPRNVVTSFSGDWFMMERLQISNEWGAVCIYSFRAWGSSKKMEWDLDFFFLTENRNSQVLLQSQHKDLHWVLCFSFNGVAEECKFQKKFRKKTPGLKAMANPSCTCVVAGQGGAPFSGSPREADFWDAVPKALPVTAGHASSHSKVHLAAVLLPLLGCCWEKILMGTSPLCPLPVAVFPKESVKGHEPAWVCRAFDRDLPPGRCSAGRT